MFTDLTGKTRLKIGLHTHTTLSDGHKTPEEAAAVYKAAGYDAIARKLGIRAVHVGLAFRDVYTHAPAIELYDPDLSHPSYAGSCVAALALYKKLVGNLPANVTSLNLDATDAAHLCEVIDRVVD